MRTNKLATCKWLAVVVAFVAVSALWVPEIRANTVGPDAAGYTATSSTVYSFIDLVAGGGSASVLGGSDDGVALLTLPFSFQFYGQNYTMLCVSSNGLLTFVTSATCTQAVDFANTDLTTTAPPGNSPTLMPFWMDLTFQVSGAGAVYYQTQGTTGSRSFVVEWSNAYPQGSANPVTFEVVLYEGTNRVLFQYQTVNLGAGNPASNGALATVGIRDTGGNTNNRQIEWSYAAPVLGNGTAISFAASYLVGDVYPFSNDTQGGFGDGAINTLDLLAALRAITNIPGSVPAACSDRFDAIDAYPPDTGNTRGGDGAINTLDLLAILRKVTNVDPTRPVRASRGRVCTSAAPISARPESRNPEAVLEAITEGTRTAIYLRATSGLSLIGLSFSVGTEGAVRFTPAALVPSLTDTELPGILAVAWLEGLDLKAGGRILLGSLDNKGPLHFFGVSANDRNGRTVAIQTSDSRVR